MKITNDVPIRNSRDDVLGREELAELFSRQLLFLDVSDGVVAGVLGPWGSGKTSFINLTIPHLEKAGVTVLHFNPWMFSGTENLIEHFFAEISMQLKGRHQRSLEAVGKSLAQYGKIFSGLSRLPVVGDWIAPIRMPITFLSKILQSEKKAVGDHKNIIEKGLRNLENPIAVIVDDIDRLTAPEIRDVFKLIRLTANFPNIIYLTAFDRSRVEDALSTTGIPGRDYLEKILLIGKNLPEIPIRVIDEQVFGAIDEVLSSVKTTDQFEKDRWPDVFFEIVRPPIQNIRHIRRYAINIRGTIENFDGHISLVDVLALEAVRVFLPDLFSRLHESVDFLTTTSDLRPDDPQISSNLKDQTEAFLKPTGNHKRIAARLIRRLFPAAERHIGGMAYGDKWQTQWLKDRRVAHKDILRLYLERYVSKDLQGFRDAEQACGRLVDGKDFGQYLRSIPAQRQERAISRLEFYEERYTPEHVIPGVVAILNLLSELPSRPTKMIELSTSQIVNRAVYRMFRCIKDPVVAEAKVRKILPQLKRLSAKWKLIKIVGYKKHADHKLVSESAARRLEKEWRDEVRSASTASLAKEDGLLWTLTDLKQDSGPEEPAFEVPDSTAVTRALLTSARQTVKTQGAGSRAVHQLPQLQWDDLVALYGDESVLRYRIEKLRDTEPTDIDEILKLAGEHMKGIESKGFFGNEPT